ncbi:metal-dependent hydrolase [Nitrospira sp. BLG_1]|uniref:metal-dependent hydrolase n=1 Tax=Nitrospira sp. BLG_1 TaxID=3395883 RepID=UPI0039BCA834
MASAFSHAFVALALGKAIPHRAMKRPLLLTGAICSIAPDLDVIGFAFGIQYGDLWGHRGMTHSLFFAGLLSAVLVALGYRQESSATKAGIGLYLFLCTASHGVLDALTDGGLGIAFFSPFDPTRYFFPFRPVAVSPIGIGNFFSTDGLRILASEIQWIWLPTLGMLMIRRMLQHLWSTAPRANSPTRDQ